MAPPNVATRIDDSRGPDSVTIHQCECYAQIRFASLPQWNNVAKIFASPELSSPWFIIPKASATKLNHVSIYNKPRRSVCTDSIFLNRSGERGEQASKHPKTVSDFASAKPANNAVAKQSCVAVDATLRIVRPDQNLPGAQYFSNYCCCGGHTQATQVTQKKKKKQ